MTYWFFRIETPSFDPVWMVAMILCSKKESYYNKKI